MTDTPDRNGFDAMDPGPGWERYEPGDAKTLSENIEARVDRPLGEIQALWHQELSCYPGWTLIRVDVAVEADLRTTYLFSAGGQLHPIDWTREGLDAFNEHALVIDSADRACAYLAFERWAVPNGGVRTFFPTSASDLPLEEVDDDLLARVDSALRPMEMEERSNDPPNSFRVKAVALVGDMVEERSFLVTDSGRVDADRQATVYAAVPIAEDRVEGGRFFVLGKRPLTPAEFLSRLREDDQNEGGARWHREHVVGNVRLVGEHFEHPVSLFGVVFEGNVDLSECAFGATVALERCEIHGTLSLRETRFAASLSLRDTLIDPHQESNAILAEGARIEGSALLEGVKAGGRVSLARARIGGRLDFKGAQVGFTRGYDPKAAIRGYFRPYDMLNLEAVHVDGDLDLSNPTLETSSIEQDPRERELDEELPGFSAPQTVIRGGMWASRAMVAGQVNARALRCDGSIEFSGGKIGGGFDGDSPTRNQRLIVLGYLSFYSTTIEGNCLMSGCYVGGDLNLVSAEIRGSVFVRTTWNASREAGDRRTRPAVVKGQVTLSDAKADDVEFEAAELGSVRMITGEIGRLRLRVGVVAEKTGRSVVRGCRIGSVLLREVVMRHSVSLIGLECTGDSGVEIRNVRCGGDLDLWSPRLLTILNDDDGVASGGVRWKGGEDPRATDIRTMLPTGFDARGLVVDGRLGLRNVHSGREIVLRNCVIGHDLDLGSHVQDPSGPGALRTTTRCTALKLEMTECRADADLSGIFVSGKGEASSVYARRLRVEGRLLFARPADPRDDWNFRTIPRDPQQRFEAFVQGNLDLSAAEAGHVVISGESFRQTGPTPCEPTDDEGVATTGETPPASDFHSSLDVECGISFERARFRRFQVVEPWPVRHDISDMTVEGWEIDPEDFLPFLARSKPFRRSNYTEVERVLRDDAHDAEADRVYREMRKRMIREASEQHRARRGPGWAPLRWLAGLVSAPVRIPLRILGTALTRIRSAVDGFVAGVGAALESRGTEGGQAGTEHSVGSHDRTNARGWQSRGGSVLTAPFDWLVATTAYQLRTTGSALLGLVYGWGTLYWLPLAAVTLPTFALSTLIFTNPQNVDASSELLGAEAGVAVGESPLDLGEEWGIADGVWLSLRYHVPIVPITARENWKAGADHAEVSMRLPSARGNAPVIRRLPISAESYAHIIYLLHWVIWPLFLYGIARKVVREKV